METGSAGESSEGLAIKRRLAAAYDRHAVERDGQTKQDWKEREREAFLSLLRGEKKISLLEIGAGTGQDSVFFRDRGLDVKSVDLSAEMVRLCLAKGLDAQQADFHELPFPGDTFDAVFALNCLLHVPKDKIGDVLEGIRRVLKPGGLFFLGVYGGTDSEGIWEGDTYEPKRFFAMYTDEALSALVSRNFAVESFRTVPLEPGAPHFQCVFLRKISS